MVSLFVDLSRSGLGMSNGRMELRLGIVLLWMRASMNTTVKAILGIALVAIAAVAFLFWGGLMAGYFPGAGATGKGGVGGVGFEFSGYLILMLVNVGLGTVVAWMLFAKRE